MVAKARCHKCQNRFDVVDWKEGERPPCPVCGYPLTASGKKHTKLIVLVSVLILLGLTVGGIILANNNSEQNKKTSLQTAKKEKMLRPKMTTILRRWFIQAPKCIDAFSI